MSSAQIFSQIEAFRVAAYAALDAGDYNGAIIAATKAELMLGTVANIARNLGQGSQSIGWNDATAVEKFIANVSKLQNQASVGSKGVFAQSHVVYARPTT